MTLYYNSKLKKFEYKEDSILDMVIPQIFLLKSAFAVFALLVDQVSKPGKLGSDDSKNIETIIKAGKDNNVDEMNIELEREVIQGLDLKGIERSQGVNLTIGQKGKSQYKLRVKYKN